MNKLSATLITALGLLPAHLAGAPVIAQDGVRNSASYSGRGQLSSGIAQGSVFVIFGSDLGPAALAQVRQFPLGTSLAGTSISISSSAGVFAALPLYVSATQVAAILPSKTPIGSAAVTVTTPSGTSASAAITVVRRSVGIYAINQAGSGPGVIQNFIAPDNQPLNGLLTPARPGQTVTLWATGVGPVQGDDGAGPQPGDLFANMAVNVGGQSARLRYVGRSGCCAGIDQIVFDVPAGVEGCYVPVVITGSGLFSTPENRFIPVEQGVSNHVTMSIASTGDTCSDPSGLSAQELSAIQSGGSARIGAISLTNASEGLDTRPHSAGSARFSKFSLSSLLASKGIFGLPAPGTCISFATAATPTVEIQDVIGGSPLDGGPVLQLLGPTGSAQLPKSGSGSYGGTLGASYLKPGDYAIDNGQGGADIGAFRASFTVPPPLNWTNQSSPAISETLTPTITWTGGDPNGFANIVVLATNDYTSFVVYCTVRASQQSFTIPGYTYVGDAMHTSSVPGVMSIGNAPVPVRFTAPGLDFGFIELRIFSDGLFIP